MIGFDWDVGPAAALLRLQHALRAAEIFNEAHRRGRRVGHRGARALVLDANLEIRVSGDFSARRLRRVDSDLVILGSLLNEILVPGLIDERFSPAFQAFVWEPRRAPALSAGTCARELAQAYRRDARRQLQGATDVVSKARAVPLPARWQWHRWNRGAVAHVSMDRVRSVFWRAVPIIASGALAVGLVAIISERTRHGQGSGRDAGASGDVLSEGTSSPGTGARGGVEDAKAILPELVPERGGEHPRSVNGDLKASWDVSPQADTATLRLEHGDAHAELRLVALGPGQVTVGNHSGRRDERPVWTVDVGRFFIATTESTQVQLAVVLGAEAVGVGSDLRLREDLPASGIDWHGAKRFCEHVKDALGHQVAEVRLPREVEWEFVAKSDLSIFAEPEVYAWVGETTRECSEPHPVAQKRASKLGLYDLLGNVDEWVEDYYSRNAYLLRDPEGPKSGGERVVRGGSCITPARAIGATRRSKAPPDQRDRYRGFRIVVAPTSAPTTTSEQPPLRLP